MPTKLAKILFENGIKQSVLNKAIETVVEDINKKAYEKYGENAYLEGYVGCNLSLIVNGKKKNMKINTYKKIVMALNLIFGKEKYTVDDIIE